MRYGGFVLNNLFFAVFDEIITVKKSRRIRVLRDFLILSGERGSRTYTFKKYHKNANY